MDFVKLTSKYQQDIDDVFTWCKVEYDNNFAGYFKEMDTLYQRLQSTSKPVTDNELEKILTDIPLQLFAASEKLSEFKAGIEVIKLRIKEEKHSTFKDSEETSQAAKREEAAYSVLEDELFLKVYGLVVERVEHQISFSKELIMSAKKIWTARRESESSASAADTTNLPDYTETTKAYIR